MIKVCFYDTKPYDRVYFDMLKNEYGVSLDYFEPRLSGRTAVLSEGYDAAVIFVNDTLDAKALDILYGKGIKLVALRCAGYNNVDFKSAYGKIHIARVPAYSPYAVAEHAMALLLTLNRKLHRAYNRVREYNFSLNGLMGFDINGKTVGVIGTGKIGRVFIDICRGFGANVIAYDPYPVKGNAIKYVTLGELCSQSDIISLHCPLTKETFHMINKDTLSSMKKGAVIINTSRGALVSAADLLKALKDEKIGGAGLDVYEEESEFFFEDLSDTIIKDDVLTQLISMPNVVLTSHQAFFTREALKGIAEVTLKNISGFFNENKLENEICYKCSDFGHCNKKGLCF